ncbi:VOC family protein [Nonomuraea angiospora]|uniref:VOC family protein n=1 Tax=Nonomuraea angiospora TaxID=46172 RepID=UPI0033F7B5B6
MSPETVASPAIRYASVTFDCPDPVELARFYGEALGLPVRFSSDDFILIGEEGSTALSFNRLAGYQRPTWPDPSREKQAHLELGVDDLDATQARLLALGAVEASVQPQPDLWRVLLDPAGHPFCITTLG